MQRPFVAPAGRRFFAAEATSESKQQQYKQQPQQQQQQQGEKKEDKELEVHRGRHGRGERAVAAGGGGGPMQAFWDPFADVDKTFKQLERMMRNPWRLPFLEDSGEAGGGGRMQRWWKPAVDISEAADKYVIHAELPGLRKEDVKINIDEGVLTLRGERRQEKKEEQQGFTRVERQYGSFTRQFALPRDADASTVKATFNNGVLEIAVPRAPEKTKETEVRIE